MVAGPPAGAGPSTAPPVPDFWGALTADAAAALAAAGGSRSFPPRRAVFHERQLVDAVLLLRRGRVRVAATSRSGREVILAFRGPGELVGELAALDEGPRSASVITVDAVEALAVPAPAFRRVLAEHPSASMALLQLLSRKLRDADAKRIDFAALNTLGRVAVRLLELCERFGREEGDVIHIALPLSQEELAGWSATSLESVVRALQTMRNLGWIETRRRELRVLDVDALRRAGV